MNARAFLGMSHSPLMGLNPISAEVERPLQDALDKARRLVHEFAPELIILVAPDHYNGFFNDLMPPFCVGTEAVGVGDYLTPAGPLNVDGATAVSLVDHLMDDGFDMAISRRMRVDHGFTQALQMLWGGLDTPAVIPVFMNAVAAPGIPRLNRCRALGASIGRFLGPDPRRTLLIGSGGLSHEPPVPTLNHPDPAVRERITVRNVPTPSDFENKKRVVMAAGRALAAGDGTIKPLSPEWDRRWMDALAGDGSSLDRLCAMDEASIARDAGLSAHESKSWLVARSALGDGLPVCGFHHYQAIDDYIAGFGIMWLTP
jgi:2,3-dihydroxyphenylpropionate 1,2-dioxygenase